jgi:hypothetical protein
MLAPPGLTNSGASCTFNLLSELVNACRQRAGRERVIHVRRDLERDGHDTNRQEQQKEFT